MVLLALLTWRSLVFQERAWSGVFQEEVLRTLARLQDAYLDGVARSVTQTWKELARMPQDALGQEAVLRKHLLKGARSQPLLSHPFLARGTGQVVFPRPRSLPGGMKASPIDKVMRSGGLQTASRLEWEDRRWPAAIRAYQDLLRRRDLSGEQELAARLGEIRSYLKWGRAPQSLALARKLLGDYPDLAQRRPLWAIPVWEYGILAARNSGQEGLAGDWPLNLYHTILEQEALGQGSWPLQKDLALSCLLRQTKRSERKGGGEEPVPAFMRAEDPSGTWLWGRPWLGHEEDRDGGGKRSWGSQEALRQIREIYLGGDERAAFLGRLGTWLPSFEPKAGVSLVPFPETGPGEGVLVLGPLPGDRGLLLGFAVDLAVLKGEAFRVWLGDQTPMAGLHLAWEGDPGEKGWLAGERSGEGPWSGLNLSAYLSSRGVMQEWVVQRTHLNLLFFAFLLGLLLLGVWGLWLFWSRERALVAARKTFVDAAAHTLRTPLARIRMLGERVQQGWVRDEAEQQAVLGNLVLQTERMTLLVEKLLDDARIRSRTRSYRFELLDPGELIRDLVQAQGPVLGLDTVSLVLQLEDTGGEQVLGDATALRMMLYNLLENAVEHSPPGGALRVRLGLEGPDWVLMVQDQGPGVPVRERERIFQRFARVEQSRLRDRSGGTGLGLFLVAHVVAGHGGRCWVEDAEGGGARFAVALPRMGEGMREGENG